MAEIIEEPSALSKIIPVSFKINDTDSVATTRLATKKQFNTTDTDAWLSFTLDGIDANMTGEFDLTMVNVDENPSSIINRTNLPFSAIPFHYKIDASADVEKNQIRHAGRWIGQVIIRLANGDTTTRQFDFAIVGHLLDGKEARLILIEDYNALMATITTSKDELAQYNIDYAALIETVTTQEAARVQAELTRAQTFDALVESEMIAQNVATKLTEKEATYAPRLLSAEQQLAETSERFDTLLVDGTPTEGNSMLLDGAVSANGVNHGSVGANIRKTQTGEALQDGAVVTSKIKDGTVIERKLSYHARAKFDELKLHTGILNKVYGTGSAVVNNARKLGLSNLIIKGNGASKNINLITSGKNLFDPTVLKKNAPSIYDVSGDEISIKAQDSSDFTVNRNDFLGENGMKYTVIIYNPNATAMDFSFGINNEFRNSVTVPANGLKPITFVYLNSFSLRYRSGATYGTTKFKLYACENDRTLSYDSIAQEIYEPFRGASVRVELSYPLDVSSMIQKVNGFWGVGNVGGFNQFSESIQNAFNALENSIITAENKFMILGDNSTPLAFEVEYFADIRQQGSLNPQETMHDVSVDGALGNNAFDNTDILQAAIDSYPNVRISVPGIYITKRLTVHDNTTFEMLDGVTLKQADNTSDYIIVNDKWMTNDGTYNTNITIRGGQYDMNGATNPRIGAILTGQYAGIGIVMHHVRNLLVEGIKEIGNAQKYNFLFADIENGEFRNINNINQSDGLHFQAPCKNILVENITGTCHDNMLAFTIGDYPLITISENGDFENITINNVYSKGETIDILRFVGNGKNGLGRYRNIKVSNVIASCPNQAVIEVYKSDITPVANDYLKDTVIENMEVSNIKNLSNVKRRFMTVYGTIHQLKVSNISELNGNVSGSILNLYDTSLVSNIELSNVYLKSGTGNGFNLLITQSKLDNNITLSNVHVDVKGVAIIHHSGSNVARIHVTNSKIKSGTICQVLSGSVILKFHSSLIDTINLPVSAGASLEILESLTEAVGAIVPTLEGETALLRINSENITFDVPDLGVLQPRKRDKVLRADALFRYDGTEWVVVP